MKKQTLFSLSSTAVLLGLCHTASAMEPASFDAGAFKITPTLGVGLGYDDNVEQAPSGQEDSSGVMRLTPQVKAEAQKDSDRYLLSYRGSYELFNSHSTGNRLSHYLTGRANYAPTKRNRYGVYAGYDRVQDTENETNRANNEDGNNHSTFRLGGSLGYGAMSAKGRLQVKGEFLQKRYHNNLNSGSLNREKEYNSPSITGTFYWRVGGKTRLLAELGYADYDYQWSGSTLDSRSIKYLGGITWQATGKTQGSIRAGLEDKDFDNNAQDSVQNPYVQANVTWTPLKRATINLRANSKIDEGGSTEDYKETWSLNLGWKHQWRERFSTNAGVDYSETSYVGDTFNVGGREDELYGLKVSGTYNARRWLDVLLSVNYKENSSNYAPGEYDRTTTYLTFRMSM